MMSLRSASVRIGQNRSARPMLADWHTCTKSVTKDKRTRKKEEHRYSPSRLFERHGFSSAPVTAVTVGHKRSEARSADSGGGSDPKKILGEYRRSLRTLPVKPRSRSFPDTPVTLGHSGHGHGRSLSGHGHGRSPSEHRTNSVTFRRRSEPATGVSGG